ncbi:ABC transporter permease [Ascidiimonas aurantiaca]|uniref:ABC transporter permease n=1 Tax=Ascidiimonas aurantiaca TaxID=1685432 RepID=UPI0030EDBFFD
MSDKKGTPPQLPRRLLDWIIRDDLVEEILGDLEERFHKDTTRKSSFRAKINYWYQTMNYLRPFAIQKSKLFTVMDNSLYKLHFKIFFRNAIRQKSTFFIKIIGLSTGLACVMLIALWVFDELSMDKFHENDTRLYQIIETPEIDGYRIENPSTAGLVGETLAQEFPEIQNSTSVKTIKDLLFSYKDIHLKAHGLFTDPSFFDVFTFKLAQGDKKNILPTKNSVLLSEALATRLFGSTNNVIGKVIQLYENRPFRVTGILEKVPNNSSIKFDFVLPFELFKEISPNSLNWDYNTTNVYVVLKEGTNMVDFNAKIKDFISTKTEANGRLLSTRLFSDNYLYDKFQNREEKSGRITYVRLFSLIAFLILIIACINFMNLSTANASRRLKEIGIKKVIGSKRNSLVSQYLMESLSTTIISSVLALLIVVLLLPQFNTLASKEMELSFKLEYVWFLGVIVLVTGLLAGSYPAFYLSRLNTINTLKGKLKTSFGEVFARRGLVIFQFTISTILILSVFVVYTQLEFAQKKNLGYDKDNLVYFDMDPKIRQNLHTYLSALEQLQGVKSASSISTNIVGGNNTNNRLKWPGQTPDKQEVFQVRPVNYGMIETLDIGILEGRSFSKDYGAEESKIIFNQTAINAMGLKDPIGKTVSIENAVFEIVGITKDFHFATIHEEIKPMFFVLRPEWTRTIMVKIQAGKEKIALNNLQDFYEQYSPGMDFNYKFLDETYASQYVSEQRVSTLARYFAGLAILISCLGLFGLAIFNAERRKKEISIRKVLGQSATRITIMLASEFAKPVLISIIIALPIAYFLIKNWLSSFAYRIPLYMWYFLAAGFIILTVAMLTVGGQAIKAANNNPVDGLRNN